MKEQREKKKKFGLQSPIMINKQRRDMRRLTIPSPTTGHRVPPNMALRSQVDLSLGGEVDPVDRATGVSIKSIWTAERRQLIYGDVLFDAGGLD